MARNNEVPASQMSPEDYALVLAQERLVVETQVAIHQLLERAKLTRADLAKLLGVSAARVSQMFGSDASNLTLRTLARIYHVLGTRCRVAEADDATTGVAPGSGAGAAEPAEEEASLTDADFDDGKFEDARTERSASAASPAPVTWWNVGLDEFEILLSEDDAFAKQHVWVVGGRTFSDASVANDDHPIGRNSPRGGIPAARDWAVAERLYARA